MMATTFQTPSFQKGIKTGKGRSPSVLRPCKKEPEIRHQQASHNTRVSLVDAIETNKISNNNN
jgi:hypothetical protein